MGQQSPLKPGSIMPYESPNIVIVPTVSFVSMNSMTRPVSVQENLGSHRSAKNMNIPPLPISSNVLVPSSVMSSKVSSNTSQGEPTSFDTCQSVNKVSDDEVKSAKTFSKVSQNTFAPNENASSSEETVKKPISWATSYLQSIGQCAKPIKLNLSSSKEKNMQKTDSPPEKESDQKISHVKGQKIRDKYFNATKKNRPYQSTYLIPRVGTKTLLTNATYLPNENININQYTKNKERKKESNCTSLISHSIPSASFSHFTDTSTRLPVDFAQNTGVRPHTAINTNSVVPNKNYRTDNVQSEKLTSCLELNKTMLTEASFKTEDTSSKDILPNKTNKNIQCKSDNSKKKILSDVNNLNGSVKFNLHTNKTIINTPKLQKVGPKSQLLNNNTFENNIAKTSKSYTDEEASSSHENKKVIQKKRHNSDKSLEVPPKKRFHGHIKSVVQVPEVTQVKHPRVQAPKCDNADDAHEFDFDLRSRLSRKNDKQCSYKFTKRNQKFDNAQEKDKIDTPRENLVVMINRKNNDVHTKEQSLTPQSSKQKQKTKKYKKILVINVLCEESGSTSDDSISDDDKSKDNNENYAKQNLDLSFLDDFNIDEIVNSLKHSPRRDNTQQDITIQTNNVENTKKLQSTNFVQPNVIKGKIKTEYLETEKQLAIFHDVNNCEELQENLRGNMSDNILVDQISTNCKMDNKQGCKNNVVEVKQNGKLYILKNNKQENQDDEIINRNADDRKTETLSLCFPTSSWNNAIHQIDSQGVDSKSSNCILINKENHEITPTELKENNNEAILKDIKQENQDDKHDKIEKIVRTVKHETQDNEDDEIESQPLQKSLDSKILRTENNQLNNILCPVIKLENFDTINIDQENNIEGQNIICLSDTEDDIQKIHSVIPTVLTNTEFEFLEVNIQCDEVFSSKTKLNETNSFNEKVQERHGKTISSGIPFDLTNAESECLEVNIQCEEDPASKTTLNETNSLDEKAQEEKYDKIKTSEILTKLTNAESELIEVNIQCEKVPASRTTLNETYSLDKKAQEEKHDKIKTSEILTMLTNAETELLEVNIQCEEVPVTKTTLNESYSSNERAQEKYDKIKTSQILTELTNAESDLSEVIIPCEGSVSKATINETNSFDDKIQQEKHENVKISNSKELKHNDNHTDEGAIDCEVNITKGKTDTTNKPVKRNVKITNPSLKADKILAIKVEKRIFKYLKMELGILSLIHYGRFSKIFKCEDASGVNYAVKIITEEKNRHSLGINKEKMLKELQNEIPKENLDIVYLIDGFSLDRQWCFLMDYYPKNLRVALQEKPFNIDDVQKLTRQLVSAVMVMRNNNIVHSDIKPSHILLDATSQRLKVCGFDAAYYADSVELLPNIGSMNYRAPEVILGYSAGFSIDVWASALVIFQMMTGTKMFHASYNNDMLYHQMSMFGNLPLDMVLLSRFSRNHFAGTAFTRKVGARGQNIIIITNFFKRNRLYHTLLNSYNRIWGKSTTCNRAKDLIMLASLHKLLEQMLVLDPRRRIPIEFVYTDPFLFEST